MKAPRKKMTKENWTGLAFVAPAFVLLAIFLFVPFFMTVGYSFTNYNILKPDRMEFVGLKNFIRLTQDTVFMKSIVNTFVFVILVVPLQVCLALGLALMINRKMKGISVYRLAFFAPTVLSLVVVSILWTYIYNPNNGLLNSLLGSVGIGPFKFLNDPKTAMLCIVILSAWQGCGFQMMIFLSGLKGVSQSLYEAARVEGANRWQIFTHITWPSISKTTFLVTTMLIISSFQVFDQAFILTRGGPGNATITLVYYIYNNGFNNLNMGYASSISMVLFLIILVFSVMNTRLNNADI